MDKAITCSTSSVQLSGSSSTTGVSYSWAASNGGIITAGANSATPTVTTAGTYTLTVSSGGCTATDVALVTLNKTAPNANAGTDKVLTCEITSMQLNGSSSAPGATFKWVASDGGNISAAASIVATPTINATGTYTLTVTDPINGCTATDVALVTFNGTSPTLSVNQVVLCSTSTGIQTANADLTTYVNVPEAEKNSTTFAYYKNGSSVPITNPDLLTRWEKYH